MERFPMPDLERSRERDWQKERVDKIESGFEVLHRMKAAKRKGKITFHLDGSGMVAKVEVAEFV
jgi:hypothetical protein